MHQHCHIYVASIHQSPINRDRKSTKPRQLHNTQWGMICPAETPEGTAVGLVKNLALMAYITVGSNSNQIRELLEENIENLYEISPVQLSNATKVFLNGCWVGVHTDPLLLINILKSFKQNIEVMESYNINANTYLRYS